MCLHQGQGKSSKKGLLKILLIIKTLSSAAAAVSQLSKKRRAVRCIEGVIDKDHATSLLARRINADLMVITTGVEKVAVNFKKADEEFIDCMTIYEAKKYYKDGKFLDGSMGPKILAAIDFIEHTGNEVIITLPEKILAAIDGKTGTRIIRG